jgi:hypothetical protein
VHMLYSQACCAASSAAGAPVVGSTAPCGVQHVGTIMLWHRVMHNCKQLQIVAATVERLKQSWLNCEHAGPCLDSFTVSHNGIVWLGHARWMKAETTGEL